MHYDVCFANAKSNISDEMFHGDLAQLGERLPCTQEARGSIPLVSTIRTLKTEQCISKLQRKEIEKFLKLSKSLRTLLGVKITTIFIVTEKPEKAFSLFFNNSVKEKTVR